MARSFGVTFCIAGIILSGLAWGTSVEIRFARTPGIVCELQKHTELLNWIGAALEAKELSDKLPLPPRPLVNEPYDCGG